MSDQIILAVIILLIVLLAWRLGNIIGMINETLLSRKDISQHTENSLATNLWQISPNGREHITPDPASQRWTDKITAESPWMRIAETHLQDGLYSL